MESVGSVPAGEVPAGRGVRPGQWSGLAVRILEDHKAERVTVVKVRDREEMARMRNGMADKLRQLGWLLRPSIVDEEDGLRVFLSVIRRPSAEPAIQLDPPPKRRRVNSHDGAR